MNYFLIGRPNVGKSSIFNILTSNNYNIVHSDSGTTRDWHKENIKGTSSYIYDTPGIIIKENNQKIDINFDSIIIGYWHRKTQWKVELAIKQLENPMNAKMFRTILDVQTGKASDKEIREFREFLTKIESKE